ncbi:MAG: TetR/AcrR family transcriptional regulator [Pseudomonadota bacterium]
MTGTRGRKAPDGTRDRIIHLTRERLAAGGLSDIKARPIAAAAGISVGTIYNMFGHLDDLVRLANGQTYDDLFAHQQAALQQARHSGRSPTEQLHALAHAYLDWIGDHHVLWSATLAFNQERMDSAPTWYRQKEQALLALIEQVLDDFPCPFEETMRLQTARALWASIHGIVSMAMGQRALLLPIEEIHVQIDIVVEAVAKTLGEPV